MLSEQVRKKSVDKGPSSLGVTVRGKPSPLSSSSRLTNASVSEENVLWTDEDMKLSKKRTAKLQ